MESPSQVSDVSDDALGNMSCESSEFEDDIELEAGAAAPRAADIRPYMYEPEESSGSDGGRISQCCEGLPYDITTNEGDIHQICPFVLTILWHFYKK